MSEFISDILKSSTIEEQGFNCIDKIILNAGNYTDEQKRAFVFEFQEVLFDQYANLTMVDLSNIDIDEKALKTFFRMSGTANIKVSPDSTFYTFLQSETDLSDIAKKRLGLSEKANNQEVYNVIIKAKLTSFASAIIPAKDLLKLDEFMDLSYANMYHIAVNDEQDIAALDELKGRISYKGQIILVGEGLTINLDGLEDFEMVNNIRNGNVKLSESEGLFFEEKTRNDEDKGKNIPEYLDTEEILLSIRQNKCVPARAVGLIDNQSLDEVQNITISVDTEEDKEMLEKYKGTFLQGKIVSLVSQTVSRMPLEVIDGINIGRIMIGIDESKHGKYDEATYRKIYEELEAVTQGIDEGSSDYDKFQAIYEELVNRLRYDYRVYDKSEKYDKEYARNAGFTIINNPSTGRDVSSVSNLEGLINGGYCVCEGFAEILKQALSMCDIKSHLITGNTTKERDSGHAWNRVVLAGKLYNCDLTWDKDEVQKYGIYKKSRPKRVLKANPNLSKKIMPRCYLKSDKEFSKDHIPFVEYKEEATEDFDADAYYQKDFRRFLKDIFGTISTRLCQTAGVIMQGDINNWERGRKAKEENRDDRSI